MKRSVDDGRTWGPLQVVAENIIPTTGRRQVAQNVTAVVDHTDLDYPDGKIIIVYNSTEVGYGSIRGGYGVRRTITAWSGDHGHTWNWDQIDSPTGTNDGDITNQVSYPYDPDYITIYDADYARANYNPTDRQWSFIAPTLGHSIQLTHGDSITNGRLLIAGHYAIIGGNNTENYVYWSDDHGETWQIGGLVNSPRYYLNEATVVELENGDVLINSRAYRRSSSTSGGWYAGIVGRVLTRGTFDDQGNISFKTPERETDLTTLGYRYCGRYDPYNY